MPTIKITGKHVRAARVLLEMSQEQLAQAAGVTEPTVSFFETGAKRPHPATREKLREALERRGIEFMNGNSPGVLLHGDKAIIPV